MSKKYIEVPSIEEVKATPMTAYYDEKTNILHLHSKYRYRAFHNWRNRKTDAMRGENIRSENLYNQN